MTEERKRSVNNDSNVNPDDPESVRGAVRARYGSIANSKSDKTHPKTSSSCCGPSKPPCCGAPKKAATGKDVDSYAASLGYDASELEDLPEGANMGLSCGNPVAIAALKEGETVLDLGSGGGFDVFLAGKRVGATGYAMGVDMTPEMLEKARKNAAIYTRETGYANVEFRLGEIENLPVADSTVDVVISNCVVNLSPDKPRVWRELCRVLKPGGRVSISDLAKVRPLPESIASDVNMLVGCIAGAVTIDDSVRMAEDAGLTDIQIERKDSAVDSMFGSTITSDKPIARLFIDAVTAEGCRKPSDYITSITITAVKPSN